MAMEKYGTPEKVTHENGQIKVASGQLLDCCKELMERLPVGQPAICLCGNRLVKEKE